MESPHRVVHGRNLLTGVPWAFGHRTVGLVVGDKTVLILGALGDHSVVAGDSGLEVLGVHAGLGGKFVKGICLHHGALRYHVFNRGAVGVDKRAARITQMVHKDPVGGLGKRIARCTFVHEAVAVKVDEQAVSARGTDVFHQTGTRRAAWVNLNVGHADDVSADSLPHDNAVPLRGLGEVCAADGAVKLHFFGAEPAGRKNHGVFSVHGHRPPLIVGNHRRDAAVFVYELFGSRVGQNRNRVLVFGKVLLKHTDVGVSGRRCWIVASLPESSRGR